MNILLINDFIFSKIKFSKLAPQLSIKGFFSKIILSGDAFFFRNSLLAGSLVNHDEVKMKRIVFIYGIIGGVLVLGISALIFVVLGDQFSHAQNELFGYLVMIISLSIIFVGIKQYRDKELGGVIKFKQAFLVGLYMSLIAGTIYVANWEVYMQTAGDSFIENYQASIIENMQKGGSSEEEIAEQREENEKYKKIYSNTFLRILITYSEILPVGLAITLISAALLRKSSFLPDDENVNPEAQAI